MMREVKCREAATWPQSYTSPQTAFGGLTVAMGPLFNCIVQVCRPRWPAKRESSVARGCAGKPKLELPPQLSAASHSPDCHWALRCKVREGGEWCGPASQETCLNGVILPACGARAWGGLPLR